ncbi:hypothetical protein R5R35_001790 [Gryllus longicercus]|uniref:Peptidase S1 domain-containing protein n=1 Tax=Gryllus longicercus TaxID=2509291 RepID=A0AAN9VWG6_9ORTH
MNAPGNTIGSMRTPALGYLLSLMNYPNKAPEIMQMDARIINGTETTENEFPYQIALMAETNGGPSYYCGAFLISSRYAVTAAHCVDSPLAFSVRVGSLYHSRGGEKRLVDSAMKHPLYDPESNDFDVAVLLLAPPELAFSRYVQPAQLASAESDARANELGVATGWGTINPKTDTPSNTLMKVNLPILSREECEGAYGAAITARMLCAGYFDGRHDACQGDSGGPLAVGGKVVGVVSWGYGCAQEGCPGVYTSISSVRQWIREVTDGV